MFFYVVASRNISDWWLAYWISHTQRDLPLGSNISAFNITPSETLNPHYENIYFHSADSLLVTGVFGDENTSIPELPLSSASDNLAFYLGIYGGLAVANSVSTRTLCMVIAFCDGKGNKLARLINDCCYSDCVFCPFWLNYSTILSVQCCIYSNAYLIDSGIHFVEGFPLCLWRHTGSNCTPQEVATEHSQSTSVIL